MTEDQEEVINFFEEDTTIPDFFDEKKVRDWLFKVAGTYHKEIKNINYIFCSDDYILEVNKEYLDHDFYTDIITFPYQEGKIIESDIFISIDRVEDNAKDLSIHFSDELHRVIVHGLLHLCGLGDKSEEDEKAMRAAEDAALLYKPI